MMKVITHEIHPNALAGLGTAGEPPRGRFGIPDELRSKRTMWVFKHQLQGVSSARPVPEGLRRSAAKNIDPMGDIPFTHVVVPKKNVRFVGRPGAGGRFKDVKGQELVGEGPIRGEGLGGR